MAPPRSQSSDRRLPRRARRHRRDGGEGAPASTRHLTTTRVGPPDDRFLVPDSGTRRHRIGDQAVASIPTGRRALNRGSDSYGSLLTVVPSSGRHGGGGSGSPRDALELPAPLRWVASDSRPASAPVVKSKADDARGERTRWTSEGDPEDVARACEREEVPLPDQREERRRTRVRPWVDCSSDHRAISGLSQSLIRPPSPL